MTPVSTSGSEASEWLELDRPGEYRIDTDIASGISTTVTFQTCTEAMPEPKKLRSPASPADEWQITESEAFYIKGPCKIRHTEDRDSGSGDVKTHAQFISDGVR